MIPIPKTRTILLTLLLLTPRTLAQQPPTAVPYKGWFHLTTTGNLTTDLNNDSLITITRTQTPAGIQITLSNYKALERADYDSTTNTVTLRAMEPREFEPIDKQLASIALTPDDLLKLLRAALGDDAVKPTQSSDRNMDRFDLPPLKPNPSSNLNTSVFGGIPTSLWADPKTHLIQELTVNGKTTTLAYGTPTPADIYDAGAPRDAKLIDNRPPKDALDAYYRIRARITKPFPDGTLVLIEQNLSNHKFDSQSITLHARKGKNWSARSFSVSDGSQDNDLQLPDNWTTTGADELFRRIANLMPPSDMGGDGTMTWLRQFDPATGEIFHSEYVMTQGPDGKMHGTTNKIPGQKEFTGSAAQSMEESDSSVQYLYPSEAVSGIMRGKLDLYNPDRPGLIALRSRIIPTSPGPITYEEWFDPAHDDRAVIFVTTMHKKNPPTELLAVQVQEFSDYITLPAPDSRSIPTTVLRTDFAADPSGTLIAAPYQTKLLLHFFPNQQLPEIPIKPQPTKTKRPPALPTPPAPPIGLP